MNILDANEDEELQLTKVYELHDKTWVSHW